MLFRTPWKAGSSNLTRPCAGLPAFRANDGGEFLGEIDVAGNASGGGNSREALVNRRAQDRGNAVPAPIPGVILAGGLARRMGGGDKGLRELGGKLLMVHVVERLSKQASPLAINANGDPSRFASFNLPVIPDRTPDTPGPLAGILAGLHWAAEASPGARFIVTAACDTPFFPQDLVARFIEEAGDVYPAVVLAQSNGRVHPVFGLWPLTLAMELEEALRRGDRKVQDWASRYPNFRVEFPHIRVGEMTLDPFFNVNTPEELAQAAAFIGVAL
jgi:molybdenum cofactor guanylyltransferase